MLLYIRSAAHSNHGFQGDFREIHPNGYLIAKRYHMSKARNVSRVVNSVVASVESLKKPRQLKKQTEVVGNVLNLPLTTGFALLFSGEEIQF
jgi:hypothetical protein